MTVSPRVSVIVPAYNAEAFIGETLRSVLAQTYGNLDVIVSDDGSTDGTRDCVAELGSRVRWISAPNSGTPARPRNAGAAAASGSLLVFIDADDIMTPERIEEQVQFLTRHPQVGIVFSDYDEFGAHQADEGGHFETCRLLSAYLDNRALREGLVLDSATASELLLTENFASSSPLVRRAVFAATGGFDESAAPSEDFYFNFRAASLCPVGVLPRIHLHKRQHPANLSANVERVLRQKIDVRRRILQHETVARRRRKLQQRIAALHVDLAYFYTGRNNRAALSHLMRGWLLTPSVRPRLVGRLVLDVLGRDTHRPRQVMGQPS